jgi:hypothetical protein
MTDEQFDKINAERKKKGRAPLPRKAAEVLINQRRQAQSYSPDETLDFLISYTTGFPQPSTGGIIGAALHESATTPMGLDVSQASSMPESSPVQSGGGDFGASSSFSSSSDSGSSSSSDSGGSSGGGE